MVMGEVPVVLGVAVVDFNHLVGRIVPSQAGSTEVYTVRERLAESPRCRSDRQSSFPILLP